MADTETLADKARKIGEDVAGVWDAIQDAGGRVPHKLNTENLVDILPQIINLNEWNARGAFFYKNTGAFHDFYTKHEVDAMTEMPELPEGASAWFMTLPEVKAALVDSTNVRVGSFPLGEEDMSCDFALDDSSLLSPTIGFTLSEENVSNIIDWGDGSVTYCSTTSYKEYQHTYAETGTYRVELHLADSTRATFGGGSSKTFLGSGSSSYWQFLDNIYFSTKCTLGTYTFNKSSSGAGPANFSFPENFSLIPSGFLTNNTSVTHIEFPNTVVGISNTTDSATHFQNLPNLTVLSLGSRFTVGERKQGYVINSAPKLEALQFNIADGAVFEFSGGFIKNCPKISIPGEQINKLGKTYPSGNSDHGIAPSCGQDLLLDNCYDFSPTKEFLGNQNLTRPLTAYCGLRDLILPDDLDSSTLMEGNISTFWQSGAVSGLSRCRSIHWPTGEAFVRIPRDFISYPNTIPSGYRLMDSPKEKAMCNGVIDLSNTHVKEIGMRAFLNFGFKSLTLPPNLEKIEASAFSGSNFGYKYPPTGAVFPDIVFPASLTSIGDSAFENTFVGTVTFSGNVSTIGAKAFFISGATASYTRNYFPRFDFTACTEIPTLGNSNAFYTSGGNVPTIVVPDDLYEDWIAATNWSSLAQYIVKESEA